jgi:hypothetical protein
VCNDHDDHGDVELPARFADWTHRTHPAGVSSTALAPADSTDAPPTVREPRDGTRWLLEPARGSLTVALRAAVGTTELPRDVTWEVDGARLPEATWQPRPGDHTIVAVWRGRRSTPARVRVETTR